MVSLALRCKVCVCLRMCVCWCVCARLAVNQRETLALVHFLHSSDVAGWHTDNALFLCACWRTGQRGAAWQCLTLRRFGVGDQHHEAQLRAGGVCVCICVCQFAMKTEFFSNPSEAVRGFCECVDHVMELQPCLWTIYAQKKYKHPKKRWYRYTVDIETKCVL